MTDDGERLIDEKEFEEQERNLRIEVNNIYTNILLAPEQNYKRIWMYNFVADQKIIFV